MQKKTHHYITYPKYLIVILILLTGLKSQAANIRQMTVNDGLSINEVTCLYQDQHMKYLWIGTQNGLNQYNGYEFQIKYRSSSQKFVSNFITGITEDKNNGIWVSTNSGLSCYNYLNQHWIEIPDNLQEGNIRRIKSNGNTLHGIKDDNTFFTIDIENQFAYSDTTFIETNNLNHLLILKGKVWLTSANGLFSYDSRHKNLIKINELPFSSCSEIKYLEDDHAVWIRSGIQWYRIPEDNKTLNFSEATSSNKYFNWTQEIQSLDYKGGRYFIATNQNVISIEKKELQNDLYVPRVEISNFSVNSILVDNENNVWCGSWQSGVILIPDKVSPFKTFQASDIPEKGLPSRLIRSFCDLDSNNIAIATETHGLVVFNKTTQKFSTPYTVENTNKESKFKIKGNVLHVIKRDWKGRVWAGYHRDGFNIMQGDERNRLNAKIFKFCRKNNIYIADDFLFDTKREKIYILTRSRIFEYNDVDETFKTLPLRETFLSCFIHDADSNVWVASRQGLKVYNRSITLLDKQINASLKEFDIYRSDLTCLHKDSENNIWIGTYGKGVFVFDYKRRMVTPIVPPLHNSFKVVYSIIEDDNGLIWMGTNNGLYSYNMVNQKFNRYSREEGIQDNQFNYCSVYKSWDKNIFIGGINGFTYFDYKDIAETPQLTKPVFSGISVGGVPQWLFNNDKMKESIKIPFSNNSFELSFFTQDFTTPENYVYSYKLLGHSTQEHFCSPGSPKASFTNIPSGKYQLQIRVTRPNTTWSEYAVSPYIIVLPPWYKTYWAYGVYSIVFILLFVGAIVLTKQKANFKNSLKIARLEKEKTEQVSAAKLRFFTDIAHEIRTPLTLIAGPLNDLLSTRQFDAPLKKALELMQRNAYKLMTLMDELLLFRKAESGKLPLSLQKHNVADFVSNVCSLYEDEMLIKGIHFSYPKEENEQEWVFDIQKTEKVLTNLLSNAIKFTPEGGSITVNYQLRDAVLEFSVQDTGKGIEAENLEQIFERFFQTEQTTSIGFGIGLTLSKRIVEAHGGNIVVDSKMGEGSNFRFLIPELKANKNISQENASKIITEPVSQLESSLPKTIKGNLLVVEDNDDIRNYIVSIFTEDYKVHQVENGKEGFNYAVTEVPDIIISDFQMPVMDGITMCKKIKEEVLTSHIPVVLLSAFNEVEDQLHGLGVGADDYIGKPFDKHILRQKIENIILSRKRLYQSFKDSETPDIKGFDKSDKRLIDRVNQIIMQELSNEKFDVPSLCEQLGIGKTTLNDKLKALLDMSPAQYIRKTKLNEGYRLITEKGLSSADAAYATGFSPSYFATCFKQEFGISPGKVGR